MVELNLQLPDEFFEEELRDGYLVTAETKKIWAVELDLLNEFIRVCNKHNIKYFADGGTMLGAVRHKGFIPWDDDIDIVMTREEYRKLEQIAPSEFEFPYFWQTEKTDTGSMRGHAQLRNCLTTGILKSEYRRKFRFNQGIFIDVFPIDYIPDERAWQNVFFLELFEQREKAFEYTYLTTRFREKGYGMYKVCRNIYHSILSRGNMRNKEYDKLENLMMRYNTNPTKTVGKVFFRYIPDIVIWQSQWFDDVIEYPFEMLKVNIPVGYDAILTKLYGNWQTPNVEPSTHGDVIFDADKPYQEYLK